MVWIGKILTYFKKILDSPNKKKTVENAVIIMILGAMMIIAGSTFLGKGKEADKAQTTLPMTAVQEVSKNIETENSTEIEGKMETILSQIQGVGKVSVFISYASGKEIVPATDLKKTENDTNEKDNDGGTRSISQNQVESSIVYEEQQDGTKKPIILKEMVPQVKGVIVVAAGADDPQVKDSLNKALSALLDVQPHKIQIFTRMNK